MVALKRIYEPPSPEDGRRILVDRLWPRGVTRETAALDAWDKDIAPSPGLRTWFGHDPKRWVEFTRRYREELDSMPAEVARLRDLAASGRLTLIYAAKDTEHTHALVLKDYLEAK